MYIEHTARIILIFFIIMALAGCSFFENNPPDPSPVTTPVPGITPGPTTEPTGVRTIEPSTGPTIDSTPSPTDDPFPAPTPIREMITPYLETAVAEIDIDECSDPATPLIEDPDTGYNVYVTNLQRESTSVFTLGDDTDIRFTVYFNDVTGDIFFDCSCSCICLFTGGDADGILSADAFIVTGTITCTTNPDGDLVAYTITGMSVLVDNMSIETDNSSINSFIEQNIESFGAAYLPCLEDLVTNAFITVLDPLLVSIE